MDPKIAYCGLTCEGCPIFWATCETDPIKKEKMRAAIARFCNELYQLNLAPTDISDCVGCLTESGPLFSGCEKCLIRKCARQKRVPNCAYCDEYACDKLIRFFKTDPAARTRLEVIRTCLDDTRSKEN